MTQDAARFHRDTASNENSSMPQTHSLMALPSYMVKLHFGSVLDTKIREQRGRAPHKEDARQHIITELSSMGILGTKPSLYLENQETEYLNRMIKLFEFGGNRTARESQEASRDGMGLVPESHAGGSHNDERTGSLADSEDGEGYQTVVDDTSETKKSDQYSDGNPLELPLPTGWERQKDAQFSVSADGLDVSTKNLVKPNDDNTTATLGFSSQSRNNFFSVKTNEPVGQQLGIYYFEVEVVFGLSSSSDVSIGYMNVDPHESSLVSDLRGHDDGSWGYNGRDGKLTYFAYGKLNSQTCATFGNGDVIGCGVNFGRNKIFVTKNGVFLGEAFEIPHRYSRLYPVVSLGQWNAVRGNFGMDPERAFAFDIDQYVQSFKNEQALRIEEEDFEPFKLPTGKVVNEESDLKPLTNEIIKSYFSQMGFIDSLRSFNEDLKLEGQYEDNEIEDPKKLEHAAVQKRLKTLVLGDDIDGAEKVVVEHYPDFFIKNARLQFKLECLKLVINIRDQMISEAITLARDLKARYVEEYCQSYIRDVMSLISYEHPESSAVFKTLYSLERIKVVEQLIVEINSYIGLPTASCFDNLVLNTDRNIEVMVRDSSKQASTLISLLNDYIRM
ncbi:DEKNAAE105643 [Brettanomyces naardenensis]|uniref:DEKNAAE105644 n=1 Tax=Brettanomyces naardenensis TaxID=13370 RepID=A0A448YTV4_BRENA|nr:DEKNAAE105643 [Brettanomyces naardenensis]